MAPAPALEPAPEWAKAVPAKPSASTDVVNKRRFIDIQPPLSAALIGAFSRANVGGCDLFRATRDKRGNSS
jgi:hypothetical protein